MEKWPPIAIDLQFYLFFGRSRTALKRAGIGGTVSGKYEKKNSARTVTNGRKMARAT